MSDSGGSKSNDQLEDLRPKWWKRFLGYLRRLFERLQRRAQARRARLLAESHADKAARLTARATVWLAIGTLLLALASIGTLLVMEKQLGEMRGTGRQTDQMICLYGKQVAELQQQASDTREFAIASTDQAIAVTESQRAELELKAWPATVASEKIISVPFLVTNIGKTPATDIDLKIVSVLMARTKEPDFSYPNSRRAEARMSRLGAGEPMGTPDGDGRAALSAVRTEKGEVLRANSSIVSDYEHGKTDVITYAEVTYRDVFAVKHWLRSCRPSQKFEPGGFINSGHKKCAAYEGTDSNRLVHGMKAAASGPEDTPQVPCPLIDNSKSQSRGWLHAFLN